MFNKKLSKLLCFMMSAIIFTGLTACGGNSDLGNADNSGADPSQNSQAAVYTGTVNIKFFSSNPDRTQGLGLLEQLNMDKYSKENPNVKIDMEALQDEPYKQKIQAYMASGDMPDLFSGWSIPAFRAPLVKGNFLAELNQQDYVGFDFLPGALDSFSTDGKLYGLPKNADFYLLYINKKLFDDNGIKIPETLNDLISVSKEFRAKGIAPCAIGGKDRWPLGYVIQTFMERVTGDPAVTEEVCEQTVQFAKNSDISKAANYYKQLMDAKFFQDSFTSADYGTAKNLFVQGQAAMYFTGSWEMGMATDQNIPEDMRKNIRGIKFPGIEGEKGSSDSLVILFGGGYMVSSNSKVKEEAIKLMNYIVKPENYAKYAWENGIIMPPNKLDSVLTGKENDLQKDLVGILNGAKTGSGPAYSDRLNPQFKNDSENLSQQFSAGMITPDKFLEELDKAAAKANSAK